MIASSGSANPKIRPLVVPLLVVSGLVSPGPASAVEPSRGDRAVILPFPGARRADGPAVPPPVAPALSASVAAPLAPGYCLLMALAGVFAALVVRTIFG